MTDRQQVGLSGDADEKLAVLRSDTPYFREEADVYRCGVAVAIGLKVELTEAIKRQQYATKFRVTRDMGADDGPSARLDTSDGRLAALVAAHRPEMADEPYRNSQYLAVVGINYLHQKLVEEGRSLHETLLEVHQRANRADDD